MVRAGRCRRPSIAMRPRRRWRPSKVGGHRMRRPVHPPRRPDQCVSAVTAGAMGLDSVSGARRAWLLPASAIASSISTSTRAPPGPASAPATPRSTWPSSGEPQLIASCPADPRSSSLERASPTSRRARACPSQSQAACRRSSRRPPRRASPFTGHRDATTRTAGRSWLSPAAVSST